MNDTRIYNHEDIQRYLQHKMSASEMHAFEKAILDDPFLSDAIEGYKQSNESLSSKHLAQLERTIIEDNERAKVVVMPAQKNTWWKVAAIVFFIFTGTLSYLLWNTSTPKNIAQLDKTKEEVKPIVTEKTQSETDTLSTQNATAGLSRQPDEKADEKALYKRESAKANNQTDSRSDMLAMNDENKKSSSPSLIKQSPKYENDMQRQGSIVLNDTSSNLARAMPSAPEEVLVSKNVMASKELNESREQTKSLQGKVAGVQPGNIKIRGTNGAQNEFKGKIISADGKPLPFATIIIKKTNTGTSTNANGEFTLKAPDSVLNISASAIGFSEATASIKNGTINNNIILRESQASLNEVVVTGYGTQKKKDVTVSLTTSKNKNPTKPARPVMNQLSPEPLSGWEAYDAYVKKTIKENKDSVGSNVYDREDVVLEFTIDKKGRPVDITIVRTGTRNDALKAITILKKGPKWISATKDARMVYVFPFKK